MRSHARSKVPSGSERIPRLTLRFAAFTAVGLTAASTCVFLLVRHAYTVQGEKDAISRVELTARTVLADQLRPSDLTSPASQARRRQLDRLFRQEVLLDKTVLGSIYSRSGTVVYSTRRSRIGSSPGESASWLRQTAGGAIVSQVRTDGDFGRVLVTYLPLTFGGHRVDGTVELEQRFGPISSAAWRTSLLVAAILELLLLLLLAVLGPPLARATRRLKRHVEEIDFIAVHDALTTLPNRVGLRRWFEAGAAGESASVLVLDLDAFGETNDALGSAKGDELLADWVRRLDPEALGCKLVARVGEKELAMFFGSTDRGEIEELVERVRSALREPVEIDGIRIALDVTVGVALLPEHGTDLDTLLRYAGIALTHAKENGSKLAFYELHHPESEVTNLRRRAELREGLEKEEFTVYYQPQADLGTRALRGVETLLRWQHPHEGLLTAGAFIGSTQGSGIITQLDRFVLETAATQWGEWSRLGIDITVAVNLAPVNLLDSGLPALLGRTLDHFELPPSRLVLEITELAVVQDDQRTREILTEISELGICLSMDDYGTGYSSLAYLRRLPVRQVKLDRSFIERLPESDADQAIVRSTTELAHALGATVVAEGIERPEQWICAAHQGCDIAQGYLIARPMPADEMTTMLLDDLFLPGALIPVVAPA